MAARAELDPRQPPRPVWGDRRGPSAEMTVVGDAMCQLQPYRPLNNFLLVCLSPTPGLQELKRWRQEGMERAKEGGGERGRRATSALLLLRFN